MSPEQKIKTINELMTSVITEGLTKSEFVKAFKQVMDVVKELERKLVKGNDARYDEHVRAARAELDQVLRETRAANETTLSALKKRTLESMEALFAKMRLSDRFEALMDEMIAEHEKQVATLNARIADIPSKDEYLSLIPVPQDETPKFQALLDEMEERHQEEIDKLKEELSRVRSARSGGVSAAGVRQAFKYISQTEAPVGAIDGVNTTYTVKHEIFWIAGFLLNGEGIAELPNYTYSGRTITFASAIPASYSGKDWEIKYIG